MEWLDPEEVADRLRRLRRDPTEWQTPLDQGQFSLAGAQAKMALLREGERWGRPSGRIPTTHIIKPAIEGFDEHDLTEHLCLRAADLAGLRAARSEIARFGDERAIVVERYDRARGSDGVARIHQEDLCQALGMLPTSKYQKDGGPSPSRIVELLRNADPAAASRSVAAFVDALIFNWIIGGTDAHAKNYSLLLSGNQVRLAPLYDVASVLPYPHLEGRKLSLAMKVGGEYRLDWIGGRHWLRLAKELRLEPDAYMDRARDLATRAPECFEEAAADEAVALLRSSLPDRLTERVRERAASCLRRLETDEAG